MTWLAVLLGGGIGSGARHAMNVFATRALGSDAPYATAAVNMIGSLAIGILAGGLAGGRWQMETTTRAFVFVGVLGGFTTFSSFMLDSLTLLNGSRPGGAWLNLFGQLLVGFALVYVGFRLGLSK